MSKSQVEIVNNASLLATDLQGAEVESKSAFLSIVGSFMSDPTGDIKRLRHMMTLLDKGSGGHLDRGAGFGEQARAVIREVGRLLDRGEWQPDELKSVFGWTARLLQVRLPPRRKGPPEPSGGQAPHHQGKRQPTKPLGGLSGKNLDVLKSIQPPKPDDEKS